MAGILIDVIVPSGSINKYVKSIYSIFVVAVLLHPLVSFISNSKNLTLSYGDYELDKELITYIYQERTDATENNIEQQLADDGFKNIDINIVFSIENNELIYNSCEVNLKNLVIASDKQHINKYEYIVVVVQSYVNMTEEEIVFNEWKGKENRL